MRLVSDFAAIFADAISTENESPAASSERSQNDNEIPEEIQDRVNSVTGA